MFIFYFFIFIDFRLLLERKRRMDASLGKKNKQKNESIRPGGGGTNPCDPATPKRILPHENQCVYLPKFSKTLCEKYSPYCANSVRSKMTTSKNGHI